MAAPSRLRIILLLIAIAQLATEVTKLLRDWTPAHSTHTRIGEWMNPGQPDAYGSDPNTVNKDLGTKRRKPSDPSGARGPPADSRKSWPAPFPRLRPDIGFYHPWCRDCRPPTWRYERKYYDDWYYDGYYEYGR
jgi:hypothetical protein